MAEPSHQDHLHARAALSLSAFELFLLSASDSVVDSLLARLTPDLVLKLQRLSSSMYNAVEAYCLRHWNIDILLQRWFFHVSAFLRILETCNAIISGSEALRFFGRQPYDGRDMDIYVPWSGVLELGRWLKARGYVYQASSDKHPLFDAAVMMASAFQGPATAGLKSVFKSGHKRSSFTVFSFVMPNLTAQQHPFAMQGSRIQLVVIRGSPENFIINHFHSTGIMNYITSRYAVSVFPRSTFVNYTTMICQDAIRDKDVHDQWMSKYRERGFTILTAEDRVPITVETRTWQRKIGDRLTWVMPFNRPPGSKRTTPALPSVPFEVLNISHRVTVAGAMLRIGPRFAYSSMAILANPWLELGNYRSLEIDAAFMEYEEEEDEDEEDEEEEEAEMYVVGSDDEMVPFDVEIEGVA